MSMLSGGRELVAGPAEDPMIHKTGSMGPPPEYTTKDDHEWLRAHPILRCDRGRQRGAGGSDGVGPPEVFALSLFGVAGVHSGKSSRMQVSVSAVRAAAKNTVERVVRPIQALGHPVLVFGHTWAALQNGTQLRSIEAAYAAAGVRAVLFETPLQTHEHVASMAISMSLALRLARDATAAEGTSFTQLKLMRHDTWWFAAFVLPPSACVGGALMVATLCEAPNFGGMMVKATGCRAPPQYGVLQYTRFSGLHDYWLLGSPQVLEHVVGTLESRLALEEVLHTDSRMHVLLEAHLQHLGLSQRGLVRSHPAALSNVSFSLYRWRDIETNHTRDGHGKCGGAFCL